MTASRSRRRPALSRALAWFLPGLGAVALAGVASHPLTLIPLLLACTLTMAATCHAIGFDPEPGFVRSVLRRGAAFLVMFSAYTALVFVLVAWPLLALTHAPSLSAVLLLAGALVLALAVLWRLWPAFGLVFVWDDAYPGAREGSWIFAATTRSIAFGRHLAHEERFFSHFLPSALALLALAFGAIVLAGMVGVLPAELRTAALALYAIVLLPLGTLVVANRTLRALLCEGRAPRRRHDRQAAAESTPRPALTAAEREAGTPAQAAALLAATRGGDIERALALLEVGADPATSPAPEDRDQRPVLTLAALLPDTRLLRALIARGADVNRVTGGLTPLLIATRDSWHGRVEAVLMLLANGANPRVADAEGSTPLHGAALGRDPGVAAALLDAGAAIDALDQAGRSPLAVACRAANWPLARFLLERGAKTAPAGGEPALVAAAGIADDDAEGVTLLLRARAQVNAADARGRTALLVAAGEGHEAIAAALLAANADPNRTDQHGSSALMEAARAGTPALVRRIAAAHADVARQDAHGRDALNLACQSPRAHADTVRALLELGADPRRADRQGQSPLDYATAAGRWDLVALLDPQTPLPASHSAGLVGTGEDTPAHLLEALREGHWARASGFAERLRDWPEAWRAQLYLDLATGDAGAARRWLADHGLGADSRLAAADGTDGSGPRLFDQLLDALPDTTDALTVLLEAGASPAGAGLFARALTRLDASHAPFALALLAHGADPFGPTADGASPLQLAAGSGLLPVLEALLDQGADPNTRDGEGRTPLFAALRQGPAALPLVRALVAAGANPEAADANGETPLGLAQDLPELRRWLDWHDWLRPARRLRPEDLPAAAEAGALGPVERLLELGFAVDSVDARGASALLRAAGAGHEAVARRLLAAGADPALTARTGMTPLAAAVTARREALVALLLEHGALADQRLPNAVTALMIAAVTGHDAIAGQLLAAGAAVDAQDADGRSAMHAAAQFGFAHNDSLHARRLFDLLLAHGVDVNLADREGKTPLLLLLGAQQRPGTACDATHIGALLPVLLDAGARLGHADQRGVTALHACAMHALLAPARLLLARGADRQAGDAFGRTAADVARHLGYVDLAHELGARSAAIPSVRQTLRQPAQSPD